MAYLKPPWYVRSVINRLAMWLGTSGTVTLVLPRRQTGDDQEIPVIPVEHGDGLYLVSTRGEAAWVRNLRAAGRCELRRRGRDPERYTAEEVPVEERAPIIEAYRVRAGRAVRTYWKRLPDPADHPTFRLTPAATPDT